MKKSLFLLAIFTIVMPVLVFAEEMKAEVAQAAQETAAVAAEAVGQGVAAPAVQAEAPVEASAAAQEAEQILTDNLEFVSGEVSATNEADRTVTVKLYGESETETTDKTLTVKVDENTDITDGEADKDMKALNVGTEVDVEYDPASSKATYIFVY